MDKSLLLVQWMCSCSLDSKLNLSLPPGGALLMGMVVSGVIFFLSLIMSSFKQMMSERQCKLEICK